MKKFFITVIAAVSMTSCGFGPYLTYNVGLSNVEAPADAKKQYGETKIVKLDVDVHIPEHTRSLSGSLLGYKTIP